MESMLCFGEEGEEGEVSILEYVEQHVQKLKAAYEKAGEKLQAKAKDREGDQTTTDDLPIGTLVLLRNCPLGRNKKQDAGGPKEYVVVERIDPDHYVYRVEPKHGSVDKRILKRINLNPISGPNNRDKEPFNTQGAKCQPEEDRSTAERSSDDLRRHQTRTTISYYMGQHHLAYQVVPPQDNAVILTDYHVH